MPAVPVDQADLSVKDLARAILARQIRPRVSSVRRLAQAVLESRKKGKKARNKKLARIPGQKGRKAKAASKTPSRPAT